MSRQDVDIDYHKASVEELCQRYNTDVVSGLDHDQAKASREKYGENVLNSEAPTTPEWVKMCKHIFTGPAKSLWLGAIPCFVAHGMGYGVKNLYLGASLSSVVTLAGFYSYIQNTKTENIIASMTEMGMHVYIICRRNGDRLVINTAELTIGDIVEIKQGDTVPADIRILESNGLKVDMSSLTGESEPKKRTPRHTHDNPLETENLAFYGTRVMVGSGVGMVVEIGDNTIYGRIAGLATVLEQPSPQIDNLISKMSSIAVFLGAGLATFAYLQEVNWLYPIIVCIGVLPMMMHASLNARIASAFDYLAGHNCLVKNMEALETLSEISCICSSKTGLMTQSRMTAAHLVFDNEIVTTDLTNDQSGCSYDKNAPSFKILERAAVLCNSAQFQSGQEGVFVLKKEPFGGNATDYAILKCTELMTGNVEEYREKNKKVCEIPFNSHYKFQVSVHETEDPNDNRYLVVMQGAPEKIMKRCKTIIMDGSEVPLTQELQDFFNDSIEALAGLGERVIGFCDMMLPEDKYPPGHLFDSDSFLEELLDSYQENFIFEDFRLVGLMALIDPPRAAVPDAINKLTNKMNMKIVMVTGDHPTTAKAIASSVGMDPYGPLVHGDELKDMSESELCEILKNHKGVVFARISSYQKYEIVMACQSIGQCVAMTGRQLNDTPALKTADLGIAMGWSGSDAAKNAADMILLDDNFANLPVGVEKAKYIFKTLDKLPFFKSARGGRSNPN